MPLDSYTVLSGQSVYDIALQVYGSVEGAITLWQDNTDVFTDNLRTVLTPGTQLIVRSTNNNIAVYFKNINQIIATR